MSSNARLEPALHPLAEKSATAERGLTGVAATTNDPATYPSAALDLTPGLAWSTHADGTRHLLSRRWAEYTGATCEEADDRWWRAAMHPEDSQRLADAWDELLRAERPFHFDARLKRFDGVFRWFLLRVEPQHDTAGALAGWYGTAIDIDDRKRTELLRAAEMRTLQMISAGEGLTDILNQLCAAIDHQVSPSRTTVLLLDAEGKSLWPSAGPKIAADWMRAITPLPVGARIGLCATAASLKCRVIVADVATELMWPEKYRDLALRSGIRAAWSQPILTRDERVLGTFAVYSAQPGVPTDEDLALTESAGHIALLAIEHQRSREALTIALGDARRSEEELRRITDAVAQAITVLDPDGRAIYANRVALDYTGLSLEEVRAEDFRERVFHPDDVERLRTSRLRGLRGRIPFQNEQRVRGRDGKYRWFLIQYNPLLDEHGQPVRWYATGTDIEDRKHAEDCMRNETVALREDLVRSSMFEEIVGSAPALRRVLMQVEKVAATDSTVLILGETGTGKELIARAIHSRSGRSGRAFVTVNCAAIPQSLIASELFGHEKGAFTGAIERRVGRFESAEGGTLFLDEIGELSLETQVALLRVLQEREFNRVGAQFPTRVDVRVLAATNRDLSAAISQGMFRADLFYRLNVFPIHVPALRDRSGDIPLLVEYLVERYAQKAGKRIRRIAAETLDLFRHYSWPGNVRELQNVIERAVILCDGDTFAVDASWLRPESPKSPPPGATLAAEIADKERELIARALRESGGRVSGVKGAAVILGMPRQTLESKMKKLRILPHRFKQR